MENKTVLELIAKNLEEIEFLFENIRKSENIDPLLIEITSLKAKTLYQELKLLMPKETSVKINDIISEEEKQSFVDQNNSDVQNTDEKIIESIPTITFFPEDDSVIALETPEKVIPVEIPEEDLTLNHAEETATPDEIIEPLEEEQQLSVIDPLVIENDVLVEEEEQEISSFASTEENADELVDEMITQDPVIDSTLEEQPVVDEIIVDEIAETVQEKELDQVPEEQPVITEPIDNIVSEESEEEVIEDEESVELIEPNPEDISAISSITGILIDEEVNGITEKKVLGEQFLKELSLNDKLASTNQHELKIKAQPILSIKGAIGLNDKFLFTRELFGNDISKFESAIEHLDQSATILEAIEFLESNFQWTKSDTSLKFMNLIKRRFDN